MRSLLVLAAFLALPAAAYAEPLPLGEAGQAFLSGDGAVLMKTRGRAVTVTRVPLAGGAAGTLLAYKAPARRRPLADLAASGGRAGVVITTTTRRGRIATTESFLGPATGPLTTFDPPAPSNGPAFTPYGFRMAGDVAFQHGGIGRNLRDRLYRIEPDGTRTRAGFGGASLGSVAFGGDYAAYGDHAGSASDNPPTRLVVLNWRTGEVLRDEEADPGVLDLDVREDGAVVMDTDGDGIRVYPPSGPPRRVAETGASPVWAGERIVVRAANVREGWQQLRVIEPDGSRRPLGTPSQSLGRLTANAGNVVWWANGCALTTPVTGPPATAIAAGPCRRSEAVVRTGTWRAERPLRIRVRCLSAPASCTGTLSGRGVRTTRFDVPPGRAEAVAVSFTRRVRSLSIRIAVDDGNTQDHPLIRLPVRRR